MFLLKDFWYLLMVVVRGRLIPAKQMHYINVFYSTTVLTRALPLPYIVSMPAAPSPQGHFLQMIYISPLEINKTKKRRGRGGKSLYPDLSVLT